MPEREAPRPRRLSRRTFGKGLSLAVVASTVPVVREPRRPRVRMWSLEPRAGILEAPGDFALIGAAWPAASGPPPRLAVRTSEDGVTWSAWHELHAHPEEGPDPGEGAGLVATTPLWVDKARFVRTRWIGRPPSGARLRMVDPGRDAGPSWLPAAEAIAPQPRIFSRAEWGADESLRRGSIRYASNIRVAFVHHTATTNSYGPGDSARIVRSIYAFHVQNNGWNDIGYNLLVDRHGQIFEGRAGGIDRTVVGAHAQGFNAGSTGIAVIGTLNSGGLPTASRQALENLLAWKLDIHHVDPEATTSMVSGGSNRWPQGTTVSLRTISGHRDVGHTTCPGDSGYSLLGTLRHNAARIGLPKLYEPRTNRAVFRPVSDSPRRTVESSVRPSAGGAWTVTVLDRSNRTWLSRQGSGSNLSATWDGRDSLGALAGHGRYRFRWTLQTSEGQARPAEVSVLLAAWPDGVFIQEPGSPVFRLAGGRLQGVQSGAIFTSHAGWHEIASVPRGTIAVYRQGARLTPREGSLITFPNGPVYFVSNGQRRGFRSASDFNSMGYPWGAIRAMSRSDVLLLPEGSPMNPGLRHPSGTLVKGSGAAVFWIQNGMKLPIRSGRIFSSWFDWGEIVTISDTALALYPTGADLPFRDGTLILTPNGTVWVISNGARRPIPSAETFDLLGLRWSSILAVSWREAETSPAGPAV